MELAYWVKEPEVTEHTGNTHLVSRATAAIHNTGSGASEMNQFTATKTDIIQHQDIAAGFGEPFLFITLGNSCFFLGHFNMT